MNDTEQRASRIVQQVASEVPAYPAPQQRAIGWGERELAPIKELFDTVGRELKAQRIKAGISFSHGEDIGLMRDEYYGLTSKSGEHLMLNLRIFPGDGMVTKYGIRPLDEQADADLSPLKGPDGWISGQITPAVVDVLERFLVRFLTKN